MINLSNTIALTFLVLLITCLSVSAQNLEDFRYEGGDLSPQNSVVKNEFQFNGYTNYWHDTYTHWYRYGNLFKMAVSNVEKTILQNKVDLADDIGIPGLVMQEGFINEFVSGPCKIMDQPQKNELEQALGSGNVLVYIDPKTSLGKEITAGFSDQRNWPEALKSHQYGAVGIKIIDAFYLENGDEKLFVVSSGDISTRNKFKELLDDTQEIIRKYDFYKGWFGAYTLLNSVTITAGHPLEVIGTGMNEGNSWFVFSGYMDFLLKEELSDWMKRVKLPVVTDVGYSAVYGCEDYDGFQVQQVGRRSRKVWVDYAHKKGGYVFRNVWDTLADPYHYDGYFANEGNKEQIDNEDVPFVLRTGKLEDNATSSMVLFLEKGEQLTRESMWQAILDRREVGILGKGKMMGPALFRNALELLLLDREFLENYFGDPINLVAKTDGYDLLVTVTNKSNESVSGNLELTLPNELKVKGNSSVTVNITPGSTKTQHFILQPGVTAMDNTDPIAIHYKWNGREKSTLTMLDLPPVISVHRLLYGHAPNVSYPVTIHNFTNKTSFPVKVQVVNPEKENNVVYEASQSCDARRGTFKDMLFNLEVPAGAFKVIVSALGVDYTSQLGVGLAEGEPLVYEIDLNSDGINEFRMENDSVEVTLLTTGARIIEYIVKGRNDNVLFKLWPKKVVDQKRPFRERAYYPYGGFEDFLGQGSMENHRIYEAEIVKKEGDYVRVKMWTDFFGNRLEKTFTLYGNSPLLEIRWALTFKNPNANVLGPQPILALGKKHWTEDVFTIPELGGLREYRMVPEDAYGRLLFVKEGWNAAYDTKQNISFVGAFPVDQPLFLHMWMNHPRNHDTHYYYAELQPWVPIYQKSTMYFSYYIWGTGESWEHGVKALRKMNLITIR